MKNSLTERIDKLNTLVIFREFLKIPAVIKLKALADSFEKGAAASRLISDYCAFVSELYKETGDWSSYVNQFIMKDENFYVKKKAMGCRVSPSVEACLKEELSLLHEIASLTSSEIKSQIPYEGFLPDWTNSQIQPEEDYRKMIKDLPVTGYGIYAKYHAFCIKKGVITPVKYPDGQSLSQLFRYQRERDLIIKNTEALVSGKGASNMLLYGDAGTGKSSTIKAVANAYAPQGLRLIEVKKNQLFEIPDIVEELSANPLKFILFIDDLSFAGNDDNFSALKAVLEGSVSAFGDNVAIYATSNRRHLVKESMNDRDGDDLHINDTLQEIMSLAARFGLTITFDRPDKDTYLEIVENLAKEYGLDLPKDELFALAERHAIRCNGRSPRVAKQFVELQKIGL